MKRKKCDAESVFTLFQWNVCKCCKNEFRREFGWKTKGNCGYRSTIYLCHDCARSGNDAHTWFNEHAKRLCRVRPKRIDTYG